jgi:hypothetical protein
VVPLGSNDIEIPSNNRKFDSPNELDESYEVISGGEKRKLRNTKPEKPIVVKPKPGSKSSRFNK